MDKVLVLDAGHSLITPGKITTTGVHEWQLNNAVCNYIAEYLNGYNIEIVRSDDITGSVDIPLATRLAKAKSLTPILCLSVHHNAGKGTGIEAYVRDKGARADSIEIASLMASKVSANTGLRNRGKKASAFYMCTVCNFPTVLFEGGFMDTDSNIAIITSESGQRAYAKGVADAIIEYFGLVKNNVTVPINTNVQTACVPQMENSVSYQVKITADVLNVRSGAGADCKINTTVKKGEVYTIVAESNGWGKLKSGAGWISLFYTSNVSSTPVTPKSIYPCHAVSTGNNVNVRKGPGTNYGKIAGYPQVDKGNEFTVYGLVNGWYKVNVAGYDGYIIQDYVKLG